jgi:drug/metabolite transporter (DMT)-like permease
MASFAASRLRDIAVVALVPLLFSTNSVIGRAVAGETGPWTLASLRWTLAFLILLPISLPAMRAHRGALTAHAAEILLLSFLGMWICGGVFYQALHFTTATNATLVYASSNVLILILEWLFRGRRIGLRQIVGTVLALAGVAVVAVGAEGAGALSVNPGDALVALASLSWAIYSVVLKRPGLTALPGIALFGSIMLGGVALLLPMMMWEALSGGGWPATPFAWSAVLMVALLPSVGAYSGYQYGIRRFGPSTMAMSSYLWTPYAIILAVMFLGEELQIYHFLGFALILPGIILATARLPAKISGAMR